MHQAYFPKKYLLFFVVLLAKESTNSIYSAQLGGIGRAFSHFNEEEDSSDVSNERLLRRKAKRYKRAKKGAIKFLIGGALVGTTYIAARAINANLDGASDTLLKNQSDIEAGSASINQHTANAIDGLKEQGIKIITRDNTIEKKTTQVPDGWFFKGSVTEHEPNTTNEETVEFRKNDNKKSETHMLAVSSASHDISEKSLLAALKANAFIYAAKTSVLGLSSPIIWFGGSIAFSGAKDVWKYIESEYL